MDRIKVKFFFFLFLLNNHFSIFSQEVEKIVTDRPDVTESALTVPLNHVQIETGFVYEKITENSIKINSFNLFTTLLRYGIFSSIELRAAAEYLYNSEERNGLTGIFVGSKFQIIKEDENLPDASLLAHLILPVGGKGLKPDKVEPELILSIAHDLNENYSIGYNLGGNWNSSSEEINYLYSIAVGTGLTEKIGTFFEVFGELSSFADPFHYFDTGLTYLIKDNFQLDVSIGTEIKNPSDYWFINTGLALRIPE